MSGGVPRHEWVVAPFRADRNSAARSADVPWLDVDAHQRLRGPYSATSELVRRLAREAHALAPDLIERYRLTLVCVAPEWASLVPSRAEISRWLTLSREGHPPGWTLRLAQGAAEFLVGVAGRVWPEGLAISIENVDLADPLDCECLAALLRRADPRRLRIRIGTGSTALRDPLRSALETHADTIVLDPSESLFLDDVVRRMASDDLSALARAYVASDCTSDDLVQARAYAGLPDQDRRALHRERAAELEARGEISLALGAIPFHHEQSGENTTAILFASKHCLDLGYYEAALDWATRGLHMDHAADRTATLGALSRNRLFSLLLLQRYDEVEHTCEEYLERRDSALLAHTAYARAMLFARSYEPARRDYDAAGFWVERSIEFAQQLPPSDGRDVGIAFLRNTMALVEMRKGHPDAAHRLLTEAMHSIASETPDDHDVERVLLLHNRARLHVSLGRTQEAIDDLTVLLQRHPADSGASYDRGVLFQRLGKLDEALADFDSAIRWSPPYPEPHLQRAHILARLGRHDEALDEYAYICELIPGHIEALIDRALLFLDRGELDAARTAVTAALRHHAGHSRLLCLRGLIELQEGHLDEAVDSFTASIEADPTLPDAWANRATVRFHGDDIEGALQDLTRALDIRPDPDALYNRGRMFEALGKWREAVADYERALELAPWHEERDGIMGRLERMEALVF